MKGNQLSLSFGPFSRQNMRKLVRFHIWLPVLCQNDHRFWSFIKKLFSAILLLKLQSPISSSSRYYISQYFFFFCHICLCVRSILAAWYQMKSREQWGTYGNQKSWERNLDSFGVLLLFVVFEYHRFFLFFFGK